MNNKKEKDWGEMKLEVPTPKYAVSCLICGKTARTYDYPIVDIVVCDDCKKAIEYIKEKMKDER